MSGNFGLLVLGGMVMLVASYYVQQRLPAPKPRIIGIDLGTTFSCAGVYHAGVGTVEILADSEGRRVIPSVVSYTETGDILVGHAARALAIANPENTIYEAKRFLGKPFDESVVAELSRFPFAIVNASGLPAFRLDIPATAASPATQLTVTPEEIGAHVLRRLRATAEAHLACDIRLAVMSVPAEFTEQQRNATRAAAALAGLEVLRVINEPTAAAMAYGLHTKANVRFIVVFDFGGGTLDVSLLSVEGGTFVTYAMAGNKRLGGEDFSHRLYRYLLAVYEQRHGCSVRSPHTMQGLRAAAEAAKLDLSTTQTTSVTVPLLEEDQECHTRLPSKTFQLEITRQDFEEINRSLFAKLLTPVQRVLEDAEMTAADVDEVVLVGGSTRMPRVRAMLQELFGGRAPNHNIDPDEAVATGVALQAGILAGAWPLQVSAVEIPSEFIRVEVDAEAAESEAAVADLQAVLARHGQ